MKATLEFIVDQIFQFWPPYRLEQHDAPDPALEPSEDSAAVHHHNDTDILGIP